MTFGNPFGAGLGAGSLDAGSWSDAGPDMNPELRQRILAMLAQQPQQGEVPDAVPPGSSGFSPPDAPTNTESVRLGGPGWGTQTDAASAPFGALPMPFGMQPSEAPKQPTFPQSALSGPLLTGVVPQSSMAPRPAGVADAAPVSAPAPAPAPPAMPDSPPAPDAGPPQQLPTLLGLQPPAMPSATPDANNGRPPGIPASAVPANAAAGKVPDSEEEDAAPAAAKPPTAYTGLPPAPGTPAPVQAPQPAAPGTTATPGTPSPPASVAPAVREDSLLKRLFDNGLGDKMMALGAGIAGGKSWGEGIGAGLRGVSEVDQNRLTAQSAQSKAQIEAIKAQREQAALLGNAALYKKYVPTATDQEAIAAGSNSSIMTEIMKRGLPATEVYRTETDKEGNQWQVRADTNQRTLLKSADEDKTVTPLTEEERVRRGLPPGVYEKDAHGKTMTVATPPAGPADMQEYEAAKKEGFQGTLLDFLDRKGNANRAQTTINNAINPILKGAGDNFDNSRNKADAAAESIRSIQNARAILNDPNGIISGFKADDRLAVAKLGALVGVTDPSAVQNTETLRAALKPMILSSVKALGANPTDRDLKFAEAFSGGQIELDPQSIRRILDINERAARETITRHNALADKMLAVQPELKQAGPMLRIEAPEAIAPQAAPSAPAAPQANQAAPTPNARVINNKTYIRGPDGQWYTGRQQ